MNANLLLIKKLAKKIKKDEALPHHKALDKASIDYGFNNWKHAQNSHKYNDKAPSTITKGTLVYLKEAGIDGIVFEDNSRYLELCTDRGGNVLATRNDIKVYKSQSRAKNFMPLRLYLPYGIWYKKDDTKVLFNRNYNPIWSKSPDGEISKPDPKMWVDFIDNKIFYEGTNLYWDHPKIVEIAKKVLLDWGISPKDRPVNCNSYYEALKLGDSSLINEAFYGGKQ